MADQDMGAADHSPILPRQLRRASLKAWLLPVTIVILHDGDLFAVGGPRSIGDPRGSGAL